MKFHIMTLFCDMVGAVLSESILGRAQASGAISVATYDIRNYSKDKHRRVDDTPYGGGHGMIMSAEPIFDCYTDIIRGIPDGETARVVYMSPGGRVLTHRHAVGLAEYDNLIILCGHYEGVDARIIEEIVDEEISIGDYVLTGGELPACVLVDTVARLCPGTLSDSECYEKESIASGMLEYPQYTKPPSFHGREVPEVLKFGNHTEIEKWRYRAALERTVRNRPDLV